MKKKEYKSQENFIIVLFVMISLFVLLLIIFSQHSQIEDLKENGKIYWFSERTEIPNFYFQCSDENSGFKFWNYNKSIDLTFEEFRAVVLFGMPTTDKCFVFYKNKLWDREKIKNLSYDEFKKQYEGKNG